MKLNRHEGVGVLLMSSAVLIVLSMIALASFIKINPTLFKVLFFTAFFMVLLGWLTFYGIVKPFKNRGKTPEEIYAELEGFMDLLSSAGNDLLARDLEIRMQKSGRTSNSALLQEIGFILADYVGGNLGAKNDGTVQKAQTIIKEIEAIVR